MAFPAVSPLDTFKRAGEKPLSNGGKWTIINGLTTAGEILEESWRATTAFASGEDGAFWNVTKFKNPGVCWKLKTVVSTERFIALYCSLVNPTTTERSGYKLKVEETASGKCKFVIEKLTKGALSPLVSATGITTAVGDLFGLSTNGSIVTAWHKTGEGSWVAVAEASDSSFNEGFVGVGMKGNLGHITNFEAGGSGVHVHEFPITQAQSPTVGHGELARTLNVTQAQVSIAGKLSAAAPFTLTQSQQAAMTYLRPHGLSLTQAQAVSRSTTPTRVLSESQGQALRIAPSTSTAGSLDAFNRANEKPLSNGGAWAQISTLAVGRGEVATEKWRSSDTFAAGEDAAYYTAAQYANPVIIARLGVVSISVERYFSLYACLSTPNTAEVSGYRVRMVETKVPTPLQFVFVIEKIVKGAVVATLAESAPITISNEPHTIAFTVQGGVIIVWMRNSELEAFTAQLEAQDTTFSGGFVGFGAKGNIGTVGQILATSTPSVGLAKVIGRNLSIAQPQVVESPKGSTRSFALTQAQSVVRVLTVARRFVLAQIQGFALSFPAIPVTSALTLEETFVATWKILAWAAQLGKIEAFISPSRQGWISASKERTRTGGRYKEAQYVNPANSVKIVRVDTTEGSPNGQISLGICVPEAEHSGYFATFVNSGSGAKEWTLTIERWIAGAKLVLAETVVPLGAVEKSEIGISLVAGRIYVFSRKTNEEGNPEWSLLLTAQDSTFTSGYATLEFVGLNWIINAFHGASTDSHVNLVGQRGRILSTTQPQVAKMLKQPARTLSGTQPQVASVGHGALTRMLAVVQAQATRLLRALARTLTTSQAQAPAMSAAGLKSETFTASQPQAITLGRLPSRALSVAQAQSTSSSRAMAHSFAAEQAQAVTNRRALSRELDASQGQGPSLRTTPGRALPTTQSTEATLSSTPERTLAVSQAQSPSRSARILRSLLVAQPQVAGLASALVVESLSISQEQAVSVTGRPARTLQVQQPQLARRTIAVARTLAVGQGQAISYMGAGHSATFTIAQPQEVFAVEATIVPVEDEEPGPPPITSTVAIGVVSTTFGVVEKGRRIRGLEGAPITLRPPTGGG